MSGGAKCTKGDIKMTYLQKLKAVDAHRGESKYAERICSELTYLDNLSMIRDGKYDAIIEKAADVLLEKIEADGVITAGTVKEIEALLFELQPAAKSLKEIFVAHAHIDMNWQWGYNETALATVETFRTMLQLMKDYPEFTFAQSQASTYEIIAKYRPDILKEIKQRVKEGRWEVTAAEWVEPDKNLPSGESLTRQTLEAKKYLTELLELPDDAIAIDYVPDTFGHAITVPEILTDAGIKYMYHCRGSEGPCLYRYRAPSGKEILAYKEFSWYNRNIATEVFENLPKFCKQEKMETYLCVYGVGDHGGGPTRLDIERILEFRSWPLTPDIKFGTYREFFEAAERSGNEFPVIDTERNFLFSGCYTTQSRIKMANRISEARAYDAEALAVEAKLMADLPLDQKRFEEPWRNILFGHFHDIIPGSGTIETREHALGKFQDTLAALQTSASASMNAIAEKIDTTSIEFDGNSLNTRSEGAGVGYGSSEMYKFGLPSAERGRGNVRAIHIFNPTAYERDEVTDIVVWDYTGDNAQTVIVDADGNELQFSLVTDMNNPRGGYWGHTYKKYMVRVKVPALGYTTVVVKQKPYVGRMNTRVFTAEHLDHNTANNFPVVLENSKIRAVFDKSTLCLTSLTDKTTGEQLIDTPSCFFRYIEEAPSAWLVAWAIREYMKTVNLNETCAVKITDLTNAKTFQRLAYTIDFEGNIINAYIMLKQDSEMLDFDVKVEWKKEGIPQKMIPQLAFTVPVSYKLSGRSLSEIPYGTIEREASAFDIPSHGALGILGESKHIIALFADTKYGFRHYGNEGQITLLRNSYFPDPCSDGGVHNIRLGVAACVPEKIGELASKVLHPLSYVSGGYHEGTLALKGSMLSVDGNVRVSAIKGAEDGTGIVVRLFDVSGKEQVVGIKCNKNDIVGAALTDTNEKLLSSLNVNAGEVRLTVEPYTVKTVKLTF